MRVVSALLAAVSLGGIAAAETVDEAAIRKFKTQDWPRAYRTQDTALLGRMLHDDFVVVDGTGASTPKAKEIAWLAANPWRAASFEYVIRRLDIYGGDTAIVAGEGRFRDRGANAKTLRYTSTNVLVKQDGAWVAVSSQVSTPVEDEAAPQS